MHAMEENGVEKVPGKCEPDIFFVASPSPPSSTLYTRVTSVQGTKGVPDFRCGLDEAPSSFLWSLWHQSHNTRAKTGLALNQLRQILRETTETVAIRSYVLSLVVLFRNLTTHLHLLFYIVMLYPVLTGERPRLMLPWLYLQMAKNIVTDVICTVAGLLLCWTLHSCGLLALEFLVVEIISMMPSIYLWRRLRSYYFDLYYAELDGDDSFPPIKANQGLTLAQRRRATKSLDGAMSILTPSDNPSRFNSCVAYDEFFGPENWGVDSDNKVSKSLTTLLTIESQESDDAGEDPSLETIDDGNFTLAEKTLMILGLTREEVDATGSQIQKTASTIDLGKSGALSSESCENQDVKSSRISVMGDAVEPRAVGIQVHLPNSSKSTASNGAFDSSQEKRPERPKKCECCEKTKCSKDEGSDSDDEEPRPTNQSTKKTPNAEDPLIRKTPSNCCDRNRKKNDRRRETQSGNKEAGNNTKTVSPTSSYRKNDLYPGSGLEVVVNRDGIAWENLKKINFVSVINKALCNEIEPFKLQRDGQDPEKSIRETFDKIFKDSGEKLIPRSDQNVREVVPEREDGTKFAFSGPTSASFGAESDILAMNDSFILEKVQNSDAQSFDSTITSAKHPNRPDLEPELDSYFKSSFRRHSDMFDDAKARLDPLQGRANSSSYRMVHCVNEEPRSREKTSCITSQYRPDYYDGWDFGRGNLTGNENNVVRDIPEVTKSKGLENQQKASDLKVDCSSLRMAEKFLSSCPKVAPEKNNEINRASQTSAMAISRRDNSTTPSTLVIDSKNPEESMFPKCSSQRSSKDRRSLASSSKTSRSSRNGETLEERETKEMQALRAYNEKTLLKYKTEMDARNRIERPRNKLSDPLERKSPGGTSGYSFDQAFFVPSVPELEKPGRELISNIENAYARFARSKPVDPVNSEALHGNLMAKEFCDIYSVNGRLQKKDSRKTRIGDKTAMRKQHSKYSKLSGGTNESDVTSRSCKLVEGSQKGRELERTLAKENIRAQNVEVYYFERQIDDEPSTSKNLPVTTIKPFSRKIDPDLLSTVSSENLTNRGGPSSMVEVLDNPEEIPIRIEDSEYYSQLRRKNLQPRSVKEAVKSIDWSFQRPTSEGSDRREEKLADDRSARVARADTTPERQDIVQKTTENILQSIFANGENSQRGFRLGESAHEYYPIFNTVAVAMKEIVRAAALRGYSDEFISQPATEIEIPEIGDGDLYGLANSSSGPRRRSSSGFFRRCILSEDNIAGKKRPGNGELPPITTAMASGSQDEKREAVPLDQDEESPSLLTKLSSSPERSSAEVNVPAIGAEDVPEEPEETNRDLASPEIRELEDHSPEKSPFSSRRRDPEHFLQIGQTRNGIGSERVRLALHNIIFQKTPDKDDSKFEFDLVSHRGILDRFDTGGQELKSIVFEFFDQFPSCVGSNAQGFPTNLKGSEFVPQLQMLTNLYAIETKVGEIVSASEETPSSGTENQSFEQDDQPERETTTQTGTSGATNFENVTTNTSTGDGGLWRKNNLGRKIVGDPDSGGSSLEKFGKPREDDKRLLSNSSEPDSVSIRSSELLRRENFRRRVITSGFVKAIKQTTSFSNSVKKIAPCDEDRNVENGVFTTNHEELVGNESRSSAHADPDAEMLELWITDDDEPTTSQTALVCSTNEVLATDPDHATSDILLRDIETAECAIKRMKTLFEHFFANGQGGQESAEKYEASLKVKRKVSSLTKFRFPLDGELQKLQNLVQTVANYVTITRSSSTKSIKSSNEPESLNPGCRIGGSAYFQKVPTKNFPKSNTDDSQSNKFPAPKTESFPKNSEDPARSGNQIDGFSSWDKVIPLSTKRQIAKSSRKSKPKKTAAREPPRRVLKVLRLTEEKSVDFFGARSVPQRGRGLSSGYLMDSDSDGNFTVSRPPTPVSDYSETSFALSCENEQPGVFSDPLGTSGIIFVSDTTQSRTTERAVETCSRSSAGNGIKDTVLSPKNVDSGNSLAQKIHDDKNSLPIQKSVEIFTEETHVLGAESLSTDSDLQYMTQVDAAGIESELKDVVQQILSHQDRGANRIINGSKNASLTSIPDCTRTQSSADLQSDNFSPKDDPGERKRIDQDCQKRIQEEKIHSMEEKTAPGQGSKSCEFENGNDAHDDRPINYEDGREIAESDSHRAFPVADRNSSGTLSLEKMAGEDEGMQSSIPNSSDGIASKRTSISSQLDSSLDVILTKNLSATDEVPESNCGLISSQENVGGKAEEPEMVTTSYDSFSSVFSQNKTEVSEPSCQGMSISNDTCFEDFPEQLDSSSQFSPKFRDDLSSQSVELNPENLDTSSSHEAGSSSGSNDNSKKDPSPKKRGRIPRPVKGSKERK